jgi:hypothetical protein
MKTFTFRVVVDTEEDIFRDIEIGENHTFEDLHDAIVKAFNFRGDQMASFYMSNELWEKGKEIALMDMGSLEGEGATQSMKSTSLKSEVTEKNQKILYVYDFFKMWIFYIDLIAISEQNTGALLPGVILAFGESPNEDDKEIEDIFEGIDDFNSEFEDSYDGDFGGDDDEDDDPFNEFESGYDDGDDYY